MSRGFCDGPHRFGRGAIAQDRHAASDIVVLDAVDTAAKFAQALLDRVAQSGVVFDLNRVVADEHGQLVGGRQDGGGGGLVLGEELRCRRQQIGACRAFGAADFQQQA